MCRAALWIARKAPLRVSPEDVPYLFFDSSFVPFPMVVSQRLATTKLSFQLAARIPQPVELPSFLLSPQQPWGRPRHGLGPAVPQAG